MTSPNCKLLIGAQQIMTYLGISKPTFYKFVKIGLPAVVIDNRWYAYTENIDDFVKSLTRKTIRDIPEDAE